MADRVATAGRWGGNRRWGVGIMRKGEGEGGKQGMAHRVMGDVGGPPVAGDRAWGSARETRVRGVHLSADRRRRGRGSIGWSPASGGLPASGARRGGWVGFRSRAPLSLGREREG